MKVSLNDLVQMLASRVGSPFSIPLQEELKVILNYKRAEWMKKVLTANPEHKKLFLKDFSAELESVERAECPVDLDCTVLRTKKKIPTPLRTQDYIFEYVGDSDKFDGYRYMTPEQVYWAVKYNKYTKDRPSYFYINGYIYIYNEVDLEYINIRGIWPDQRQLNTFKCNDVACYTDDDQYDIADDIINTMIQDILRNELRLLISPEIGEVTVDDKTKTN